MVLTKDTPPLTGWFKNRPRPPVRTGAIWVDKFQKVVQPPLRSLEGGVAQRQSANAEKASDADEQARTEAAAGECIRARRLPNGSDNTREARNAERLGYGLRASGREAGWIICWGAGDCALGG
jgi:hypothetical protein